MDIKKTKINQPLAYIIVIAVMALVTIGRIMPHALNFAPISALALFCGASVTNKKWAFVLPIGCIVLSDLILGFIHSGYNFYPGQQYVYASYFLIILLGFLLRSNKNPLRVVGLSIVSSILFFAVTNFGMWVGSGLYAHTFSGLAECYTAAIPFFRNTFLSDLLFSTVFFGSAYAISSMLRPARA